MAILRPGPTASLMLAASFAVLVPAASAQEDGEERSDRFEFGRHVELVCEHRHLDAPLAP